MGVESIYWIVLLYIYYNIIKILIYMNFYCKIISIFDIFETFHKYWKKSDKPKEYTSEFDKYTFARKDFYRRILFFKVVKLNGKILFSFCILLSICYTFENLCFQNITIFISYNIHLSNAYLVHLMCQGWF